MNEWFLLGLGVLLTLGTGVFVASEFSMINLERTDLESRSDKGEKGLAPSIRALKRTSTHLSSAQDRKSTRLNSSHVSESRMPSSA